jgi:hypothetical protein
MIEIVESNRVLGVVKELEKELEKLPIMAHTTVLYFLKGLLEHRSIQEKMLSEDGEMQRKQSIEERQLKMMEAEQARQAAAQLERANANLPKVVLA